MSSSIGKVLKITLFGESHSKAIGLTIDGFPSGIKVNYDEINKALARRNPKDNFSTERHEQDEVIFLSGVFNDYTTGSPITFIIYMKQRITTLLGRTIRTETTTSCWPSSETSSTVSWC